MRRAIQRRQVLQLGAACAVLPVIGCGGGEPEVAAPIAQPPSDKFATMGHPAAPAPPPPSASAVVEAPPAPPSAEETLRASFSRVVGRVGKNHGHVLVVSIEDVKAGVEKTYELKGAASHPHTATLSADDMKKLALGEVLRTKSTTDKGHTHRLVARCAPPVDPPEWVSVCTFASSGQDEHEAIITAADMAAKADKTYEIQGLAGHSHQISLTKADFEKLAAGGPVTLHSTRDADDQHLHTVSITLKKATKT